MTVTKVKSRESKYADNALMSNEYREVINAPEKRKNKATADYSYTSSADANAYSALMGTDGTQSTTGRARKPATDVLYDANRDIYYSPTSGERWRYDNSGKWYAIGNEENAGKTPTNTDEPINPIEPAPRPYGPDYTTNNGEVGANAYQAISGDGNTETDSTQERALGENPKPETQILSETAPLDFPMFGDETDTTDTNSDNTDANTTKTNQSPFESQEDIINDQYDELENKTKTEAEQAYEQGKSQYEQALIKALPEYQKQREQQDYLTKQNETRIKEYSYYTGDTGGMSRQDVLQNVNSGQETIGAISLQEQMLKDDTDRSLADLFSQNQVDLAIALSQLRAERLAALENERVRLQESNAQWQQWITSQTGYMPDGSPTAKQKSYLDTLTSTGGTSSDRINKYESSGVLNKTTGGSEESGTADSSIYNPYSPWANSTDTHAQYYQDENGNWTWQPYYTNDAYKTTPADYSAPSNTDDPVNWIINSAASYPKSDGAEIMSPINDAMEFNNIMSYIGANYNDLSDTDKARLLDHYGLTEEDLLAYFYNDQAKQTRL